MEDCNSLRQFLGVITAPGAVDQRIRESVLRCSRLAPDKGCSLSVLEENMMQLVHEELRRVKADWELLLSAGDEHMFESKLARMEGLGPAMIDEGIREAIMAAWLMMPEKTRSLDRVEKEITRITRRVFENYKEDLQAFSQ